MQTCGEGGSQWKAGRLTLCYELARDFLSSIASMEATERLCKLNPRTHEALISPSAAARAHFISQLTACELRALRMPGRSSMPCSALKTCLCRVPCVRLLVGAGPADAQTRPAQAKKHARMPMDAAAKMLDEDTNMKNMSQNQRMDALGFVAGNIVFVLQHEMGHAQISERALAGARRPRRGRRRRLRHPVDAQHAERHVGARAGAGRDGLVSHGQARREEGEHADLL